jgi:chromosome segregation ATPase
MNFALAEAQTATSAKIEALQKVLESEVDRQRVNDDLHLAQIALDEVKATLRLTHETITELEEAKKLAKLQQETTLKSLKDAEQTIEQMQEAKELTEMGVQKVSSDLKEAKDDNARLQRDLDNALANSEKLAENKEELQAVRDELNRAQVALGETTTALELARVTITELERVAAVVTSDNDNFQKLIQDKQRTIEDLQESMEQMKFEFSGLTSDLSTATADNARLQSEIDAASRNWQTLAEKEIDHQTKAVALDLALEKVNELEMFVSRVESEKVTVLNSLRDSESMITNLREAKETMEHLLSTFTSDLDGAKADIARLQCDLDVALAASKKHAEMDEELEAVRDELNHTRTTLGETMTELELARASITEQEGKLQSVQSELCITKDALKEARESVSVLEAVLSEGRAEKEAALESMQDKEMVIMHLEKSKEQMERDLSRLTSDLSEAKSDVAHLQSEIDVALADCQKLAETKDELQAVKDELNQLQVSVGASTSSLELARENITVLENMVSESRSEKAAALNSLKDSERLIIDLREANEQLGTDLSKLSSDLHLAKADSARLQSEIDEALAERQSLAFAKYEALQTVAGKETELSTVKHELIVTNAAFEEAKSLLELARTNASEMERTLVTAQEALQERDQAIQDLRGDKEQLEKDLVDATTDLIKSKAEVSRLQTETMIMFRNKENSDVFVDEKARKLETDNLELKRLLANANASVSEARDAALAADEELADKEKELEDANIRLADLEEELHLARSGFATSRLESQLLEELEQMRVEKLEIESLFERQRSEWQQSVAELERRMGDEQRTLIQEAEAEMQQLREDNARNKERLSKAEAEAYNARQEVDELREKSKLAHSCDSVMSDLKRQLSLQKEAYSDAVREKEREIAAMMEKLSSSDRKLKSVEKTTQDLSNTTRQEILAHTREISELRRHVDNYETSSITLKSTNEHLSAQLQVLEKEQKKNEAEAASLTIRIHELDEKLKQRDERIKKLEATKLTKPQVAAIARIKVSKN